MALKLPAHYPSHISDLQCLMVFVTVANKLWVHSKTCILGQAFLDTHFLKKYICTFPCYEAVPYKALL